MSIRSIASAFLVVVLIGLGVYYLDASMSTASRPSETVQIGIDVQNGRITQNVDDLAVLQGDTVVLLITSDIAEEFHLHGYDRSIDVFPEKTVTLTFVASASGRFPIELEKSKTELGAIEVLPR